MVDDGKQACDVNRRGEVAEHPMVSEVKERRVGDGNKGLGAQIFPLGDAPSRRPGMSDFGGAGLSFFKPYF